GITVEKTTSPKKSRTSRSTSAVSSKAASYIVSRIPQTCNRLLEREITCRITSIIWVRPSMAKYSHWIGISTSLALDRAVRVRAPTEGGQSIKTWSREPRLPARCVASISERESEELANASTSSKLR